MRLARAATPPPFRARSALEDGRSRHRHGAMIKGQIARLKKLRMESPAPILRGRRRRNRRSWRDSEDSTDRRLEKLERLLQEMGERLKSIESPFRPEKLTV